MTTMRFVLPGGERVPGIDVTQMRAVDRSMIEDFHIELAQMMENAGRNLADLARSLFSPRSVAVLAGPEGNGGGRFAELIDWANATSAPVLALDTPSGLDLTAGTAATPCVQADATMTLALPKVGLGRTVNVGALYLADISVPPALFAAMGLEVPVIFRSGSVVAVRADDMS